eukprot:TRINITY_DN2584_c0_g2_i1.p1 TRINITY_DN2584_c0_g2~~TRINITY_DN2584_c0_g2_i1.p1  ORF type:complete len:157 (-),score=51.17 TRINITY_DN2584_c0_g2_i1:85-555(-)
MSICLTQSEIDACRSTFSRYARVEKGHIDMWQLRSCLSELNKEPPEEEFFRLIEHIDDNGTGKIAFNQFLQIISNQKMLAKPDDDNDTLEAFVALGGNPDKTGTVLIETINTTIAEYGLAHNVNDITQKFNDNDNGKLDYESFALMLTDRNKSVTS